MEKKSLKKNAAFNVIKAFMNLAFPLITFPYASRVLMPAGIGKVNFANSFIEYFVLLASLGIGFYSSREATRVRDDRSKFSKFFKEILTIQLCTTVLSYAVLFASLFLVPKLFEYRILLIICSTKILFTTIGFDWVFNAKEEYGYITLRSVFFQLLSLVFLFCFVHGPDDYPQYAAMGVFASVGSNVCNLIYSRKFIDFFDESKLEFKKHFKPILTYFGMDVAAKLHSALDAVMLGFIMSDVAVGFYSAAIKINKMVSSMLNAFTAVLLPRTSYYLEKELFDEYYKLVRKGISLTLFLSVPATVGIMCICRPLMILFSGKAFLPAIPSMLILSPTIIWISLGCTVNYVIISPQRKEKIGLYAQIIGCTLNIILNLLFIPLWGVFGAAFATMIVEATITIYRLVAVRKEVAKAHVLGNLWKTIIASLFMGAILLLLQDKMDNLLLSIIIPMAIGSIIYALTSIALKNESALLFISILKRKQK